MRSIFKASAWSYTKPYHDWICFRTVKGFETDFLPASIIASHIGYQSAFCGYQGALMVKKVPLRGYEGSLTLQKQSPTNGFFPSCSVYPFLYLFMKI